MPPAVPLTRDQLATLGHWFQPERPGPLIAQHVITTGNGSCLADRWPDPRALVVQTGGQRPRRLGPGDAGALAGLGEGTEWITASWGGPEGLAASGTGWGAFAGRRLVAGVPSRPRADWLNAEVAAGWRRGLGTLAGMPTATRRSSGALRDPAGPAQAQVDDQPDKDGSGGERDQQRRPDD